MNIGTKIVPYIINILGITDLYPRYDSNREIIGYGNYTGPYYSYGEMQIYQYDLQKVLSIDPTCPIDEMSMIHDVYLSLYRSIFDCIYFNFVYIVHVSMVLYIDYNHSILSSLIIFIVLMIVLYIPGTIYLVYNTIFGPKLTIINDTPLVRQLIDEKISNLTQRVFSRFWSKITSVM
jgi:hypothetical protein